MASASSIGPSETKAYCFRILGLVVDGGTIVLKHQFDRCIPEDELQTKLNDPAVRTIINELRTKRVITKSQWDVLYPQINANDKPSSKDFDVALLNILLRYICKIDEQSRYWSERKPPSFDTSLVADISRLRRIRNEFAHMKTINLKKQTYQQKWDDLEKIILRLGQGIPNLSEKLNELKTCTIDPENESKYIAELQQWKQNEYDWQADIGETKAKLIEVDKSLNNIATTVGHHTSQLHDVTQQLMKVEENNKVTGEKQDYAIKTILSRQTNLEENVADERNVRETQHVGTVQRFGALEEKVDHMHDKFQHNMQALADLSVEDDERDQLYVTTTAHIQAKEKLLKSGLVILSGSPGEGKTTMATKLISEVAMPGSCLKLNHPSDMKWVDIRCHFEIIFIDDIFGAGVLNEDMLQEWSRWFPDLLRLIGVNKGKRKLIITSRHYILSEAKQTVRSKLFNNGNIQTLSSSQLTAAEMTKILELHLRYLKRNMSNWMIEMIVTEYEKQNSFQRPYQCMGKVGKYFSSVKWENLKTMTGFPETVRLFVSNDELFDQGYKFFEKPYVFFRNCLEDLFLQEEKYFALFLIWSMPGQKLNRSKINMASVDLLADENISKAARWFGFKTTGKPMLNLLSRSLSHNTGGIITYHQESGEFSFCHNTAKDMVGIVVGKEYPNAILELANNEFMLQYMTVNENKNDDIHVFIEPFRYEDLNDAIVKAMKKKDVKYLWGLIGIRTKEHDSLYDKMYLGSYEINISMLKHDCFTNESFLRVFCNSEEGRNILIKPIVRISGLLRNCGVDLGDEEIPVYIASRSILLGNTKLLESFMKFNWNSFADKKRFLYMSLLMAARVGLLDAVELLLRYGAETNEESIYIATSNNHKHVVERLLENYTSSTESYNRILHKNSPLIVATKNGFVDVMKVLIKYGFNVNYRNANKKTALDKALFPVEPKMCEFRYGKNKNFTEKQFEVYKVLIEYGATFSKKTGKYKRTQLHTAADIGHTKVVGLLIEKGASLKDKDYRGHYPVHCAVIRGHCDAVREILNVDRTQVSLKLTSPGSKSFIKGMTLLHIAIWKNNHEMVKLLLEYNADPNVQDSFGRTSFCFAAYNSYVFIFELLLKCSNVQQPDKNGMTPLHAAVFKGHKRIAQLIGEVIGVNEVAVECHLKLLKGRNIYAMAALERAIFYDNVEECECLLRNGANLNYNTGYFKRTPLHFAADAGSSRTAALLISRGASLYAKDCRGYAPIQCAAIRGNNDIVKMILQVEKAEALVKLTSFAKLGKRKMDLYHIAVLGWNEGLIDVLLQHRVNPNVQNFFGKTPINVAAEKGATEIVKKLIPVADVNIADNNGHTPLHTAIHRLRTDIAAMLCPVSDVNLQDKYGDTPLHKACIRLDLEIFTTLIEKCDADMNICNKAGMSVVDLLDRKRCKGKLVKFDIDRFWCGSDPFVVQDEYFKVIVAKKFSDFKKGNHSS